MSATQVGFGLYGAVLVEEPDDGVRSATGEKYPERVLVLSEMALDSPGVFQSPETGGSAGMAFGREGAQLLVNGWTRPVFNARAGSVERWHVVNSAKTRYFQLDISNTFTIIGVDGGLQEYPAETSMLVLAPGERADVLVRLWGTPGGEQVAQAILFNRGYGSVEARMPFEDLFTIRYTSEPPDAPGPLPEVRREIASLPTAGATRVALELGIEQLPDMSFQYKINNVPFLKGKDIKARPGETQMWTISNKTKWSHPFHLHGFFFQLLDKDEKHVRPLAWKDTVDVPFEKTVSIVVKFDDRPGMWMLHCHILDHAEGGLMGMLELVNPE